MAEAAQWGLGMGLAFIGIGIACPSLARAYKELSKTNPWFFCIGVFFMGIGAIVSILSFIALASQG